MPLTFAESKERGEATFPTVCIAHTTPTARHWLTPDARPPIDYLLQQTGLF